MKTKEELELQYGSLPDTLDIQKVNTLLNKYTNKYKLVDDVKKEVIEFDN